jgi:hypothetical protein
MVLLFTLAISIIAGLIRRDSGLVRRSTRTRLRGGGRTSSASRERHRARSTLVVITGGLRWCCS